jgi:hypothetical protein
MSFDGEFIVHNRTSLIDPRKFWPDDEAVIRPSANAEAGVFILAPELVSVFATPLIHRYHTDETRATLSLIVTPATHV